MKLTHLFAAGLLCAGLGAPAANAVTLATIGVVGPLGSPGSYSQTFTAAGGVAAVYFELNGFNTMDGENCCTDVFTLSLNGTDLFSAAISSGGGGTTNVYLGTLGVDYIFGSSFIDYSGGLSYQQIAVLLPNLINGTNTLMFRYDGDDQGLADEAWGLGNAATLGNGVGGYIDGAAAVPEPASWALMIGGFALTGAALRRRRAAFA